MTAATYSPSAGDATFRAVQRRLAARLPSLSGLDDGQVPLEARPAAAEAPRLIASTVVEGHALRAVRIDGDPETGFAAFLDGTQTSRVLCYVGGLPIVFGTVAAVVRVRANRRLHTWPRGPVIERRIYAPCALLPAGTCAALADGGVPMIDSTAAEARAEPPIAHPFALLERAVHLVQQHREELEQRLAEDWCRTEGTPLFIDGGVSKSEVVATSPCAVGVIKSHRTLYVDGDALRTVLALRHGFRSSVFRVTSSRRTPVASWYLRLRDAAGRDPMWGLVRVEAADRGAAERPDTLAARADLVSRWILAEAAPLALPDGRWDKMVYGIRDCEEFLRAVC